MALNMCNMIVTVYIRKQSEHDYRYVDKKTE